MATAKSFLDLPPEVHVAIFDDVFADCSIHLHTRESNDLVVKRWYLQTDILATCRQLRAEGLLRL